MFKTLHGKLSAFLFVLLCAIGLLSVQLTAFTTRTYIHEVNQNLNRDLAAHLARQLSGKGLLPADLESNARAQKLAKAEIKHSMVLNPDIEIYVLDETGNILAYSSAPGQVQSQSVSLEPVQRFLAGVGRLPILGDDPRHPGRHKAFSAARTPATPPTATSSTGTPAQATPVTRSFFIYIILGGADYDAAAGVVGRTYILRWSAWTTLASLTIVFALGLVFFFFLTRRLRRLTRRMEEFHATGFQSNPGLNSAVPKLNSAVPTSLVPQEATPIVARPTLGDEIARLDMVYQEMARSLAEQSRERQRAETHRRELVSNVSHDLRTPLAALRGYLETLLMKQGHLSIQEQKEYLATALKHSGRLERLISELFELAKLDSPGAAPQREAFSLPELVQDVVQQFQLVAEKKGVRLEVAPPGQALFVQADIGLIERALENPLENALRHTPTGGVVSVALEAEDHAVAVHIRDTGPGIPPEDLPHIFERSYRVAKHRPEPGEGAGLGLAIAWRILELHGGTITVESAPGEGTTFTLHIPTDAAR